jgi:hypothetical protein
MLAIDPTRNRRTAHARLFGRVVLCLIGASLAILLSMQATTWAHATLRTWFLATVNRTFASTVASVPPGCGGSFVNHLTW